MIIQAVGSAIVQITSHKNDSCVLFVGAPGSRTTAIHKANGRCQCCGDSQGRQSERRHPGSRPKNSQYRSMKSTCHPHRGICSFQCCRFCFYLARFCARISREIILGAKGMSMFNVQISSSRSFLMLLGNKAKLVAKGLSQGWV